MLLQVTMMLLPIAAASGFWAGNRDKNTADKTGSGSDRLRHDYFRGLNYLINEQPDKAVDVFIKLLEVDSDTVETHLALGNLFRRRGEVDRAIRVHQNLIARPQLGKLQKVQALSALGQDYLRAGVLDRAERIFLELSELGEENQPSLRFLLHIYQQEKDWDKAIEIALKLQSQGSENIGVIIAQYYCELAELACLSGRMSEAQTFLKKAFGIDPHCVRASLISGRIACELKSHKEAIRHYQRVQFQDPDFLSEIIMPLLACYRELNQEAQCIAYLESLLDEFPRVAIVLAVSDYLQRQEGDKVAIEFIAEQIKRRPSLRGLNHLVELYLQISNGDAREKLTILQQYMHLLIDGKPNYRCEHCGFSAKALYWLCPSCHYWASSKPIQGLEGN